MPLVVLMGLFPCPREAVQGVAPVAGTQCWFCSQCWCERAAVGVRAAQGWPPWQPCLCPALCRLGIFGAMNTCEGLDRGSRSGHWLLPTALVADGTSIVDAASGQVAVTCSFNLTHLCLIHLPLSN